MINRHYDDYLDTELDSTVINCIERNGRYYCEFEDTVFYFESGGQRADRGTINGLQVLELIREDGHLWHVLPEKVSGVCHMSVDPLFRLKQAEIHTASHLMCSLINKRFNARTVAFYNDGQEAYAEMGFEYLDDATVRKIEDICNDFIQKDVPVEIAYPKREDVREYFSEAKLDHEILRTVRIEPIDYDMCGCVHVPSLRYLRMMKITHYEKTTRGYKLFYLVGTRLKETLEKYYGELHELSVNLSVPFDEIATAVEKLQKQLHRAQQEKTQYMEYYVDSVAQRYIDSDEKVIFGQFDFDSKTLNRLATMIINNSSKLVFLISDLGEKMHLIVARSRDLKVNCNRLFRELADEYGLRGGGNPAFAQGGGLNDPGLLFKLTLRYGSIDPEKE